LNITIEYVDIERKIVFKPLITRLIGDLIRNEGKKLGEINIIFTNNDHILQINKEYLDHHYYTDVITFNYNKRESVAGDIFISLDQVALNAKKFNALFIDEVLRVIIHGILHLIGYDDKLESEKIAMREMEDVYLCRFRNYDIIAEGEIKL
jgi:rRNA maturation RNase YbeY